MALGARGIEMAKISPETLPALPALPFDIGGYRLTGSLSLAWIQAQQFWKPKCTLQMFILQTHSMKLGCVWAP